MSSPSTRNRQRIPSMSVAQRMCIVLETYRLADHFRPRPLMTETFHSFQCGCQGQRLPRAETFSRRMDQGLCLVRGPTKLTRNIGLMMGHLKAEAFGAGNGEFQAR